MESFSESNLALRAELEKMRIAVDANKVLNEKLVIDELKTKIINNILAMEVQEQQKIITNL